MLRKSPEIFQGFFFRYINKSVMKLVCESLEEFQKFLDGKGKNLKSEDVDKRQLAIGIAVEKEHSSDIEIRKRIAIDHLAEDPEYYTKLIKSGIADEKEAIELYHKYYGK